MEGVKLESPSLEEARATCPEEISPEALARHLTRAGFEYGESFQGITRLWRGKRQAMALVHLRPSLVKSAASYQIHPCLLDACLRVLALPAIGDEESAAIIPVGVKHLRAHRRGGETLYCHARVNGTEADGRTLSCDVHLFDETGALVIEALGFQLRRATAETGTARARGLLQIAWKPIPPGPPASSPHAGTWLVIGNPRGLASALSQDAARRGHVVVLASSDPSAFTAELARATHVIYLSDPEAGDLKSSADRATRETARVLALVAPLLDSPSSPRLWIATAGAQHVDANDRVDPAQAALWGFGRVLATEHADAWGGLVDLDPEKPDAASLAEAIAGADGEDQLAYRRGARLVGRLVPGAITSSAATPRLSATGTYLVTGGTGGVGLEILRWLSERGAKRLVAMSRSGNVSSTSALEALRARGCEITIAQGDVSVLADVERVIGSIAELRGIVHAAAVLDDGAVTRQTAERSAKVMAPKAAGAVNLHLATKGKTLDLFVLFSSVSGVLGMPGQSTYAAANTFLGAFAHARTAAGMPTVSIEWGRWEDVGMSAAIDQRLRDRWDEWGLPAIPIEEAFHAIDVALASGTPDLVVFPFDRERFFRNFPGAHRSSLLRGLAPEKPALGAPASTRARFLELVAAAAPAARLDLFTSVVQRQVSRVLGNPSQPPELDEPLTSAGIDSLMAVELANGLGEALSRKLSATLVFNHPTILAIARHFAETWDRRKSERAPRPDLSAELLLAEIESMSEEDALQEVEAAPPSSHSIAPLTKRGT